MKYTVVVERADNGTSWGAYVPDLPGCVAVGPSAEWVEHEIVAAIETHLASLRADGDPVPEPHSRAIEIEAA